jgi:excisionase family DNA binding protein
MLGVSLSTVRRWSDAGVLPSYRTPGGQRRYNRDQLERFLRSLQRGA